MSTTDEATGDDRPVRGKTAAVLGLGIEGRDLARFLAVRGARVTIFDSRAPAAMAAAIAAMESLGVQVRLEPAPLGEADRFDLLYVSQSVLIHRDPFVQAMRMAGKPISSMLREFVHRWPGPVAAITGSSGKTTTTSLVAAGFVRAGKPHIVGGNIGSPLLVQLEQPDRSSWAILEISHTQLQLLDRAPAVAAVTNVTPNHLDQFSWDEYVALKRRLVAGQRHDAVAVLNATDPVGALLQADTAARPVWFNAEISGTDSYFSDGNDLIARRCERRMAFLTTAEVPLRGSHNLENVLAAAAVTGAAGIDVAVFAEAVRRFAAVPHRLEFVGVLDGAAYYNDSIATSPERTLAGMRSFAEPLVLLLGGRDKSLPLEGLVAAANRQARAVVLFGEAADIFGAAFAAGSTRDEQHTQVVIAGSLEQAVTAAHAVARAGDAVLLSPAGTSFDAYPNFERRGEEFRRLIHDLMNRRGGTPSQ